MSVVTSVSQMRTLEQLSSLVLAESAEFWGIAPPVRSSGKDGKAHGGWKMECSTLTALTQERVQRLP